MQKHERSSSRQGRRGPSSRVARRHWACVRQGARGERAKETKRKSATGREGARGCKRKGDGGERQSQGQGAKARQRDGGTREAREQGWLGWAEQESRTRGHRQREEDCSPTQAHGRRCHRRELARAHTRTRLAHTRGPAGAHIIDTHTNTHARVAAARIR